MSHDRAGLRNRSSERQLDTDGRYRLLVEQVSDAVITVAADGSVTDWNPAARTIYGRSAEAAIGRPVAEILGAPIDLARLTADCGGIHATHRRSDGSTVAVRVSAVAVDGEYVLVCRTVTALLAAERHYAAVVAGLEDGVIVIGRDGTIISANPAATRLLGLPENSPPSLSYLDFSLFDAEGNPVPAQERPITRILRTGAPMAGEVYSVERADGQRLWLTGSCTLLDPGNPRSPILASFSDITAQRAAEQRLEYEATHDPLTHLPNRTMVLTRLQAALCAPDPEPLAIAFIDLDGFKAINDSLGHHVGDTVLHVAAQRLQQVVHCNDLVGRLGGDEFVALLLDGAEQHDPDTLIRHLRRALREPIVVDGCGLRIDASFGFITVPAADNRTAEDLLRAADLAMYQAKKADPGHTEFFRTDDAGRAIK
ncbi:diguanylate cyclase domain-containing protein [Nocardia sp. NPDC088792]|uniref:diguanylate cyclase domain-containing protein n=1 Tax=Nocardia sp. NPDC088792 TaxID=3364332 RepID=UPI00382A6A79